MQPGRYTELFFLDEATALAAGHRPCAECRRADYNRFRDAWAAAFGHRPGADDMDAVLHSARLDPATGRQLRQSADLRALPDGALALIDDAPHLLWHGMWLPWSPWGYAVPRPIGRQTAPVLTPAPILRILSEGYRPGAHGSAAQDGAMPTDLQTQTASASDVVC
jgi:hypothetical protein